jgi:hypothetical protein
MRILLVARCEAQGGPPEWWNLEPDALDGRSDETPAVGRWRQTSLALNCPLRVSGVTSDHEHEQADDSEPGRGEALEEVARIRAELAQVPAAQIVLNHAMGLYELAAIHLSTQPPQLEQAKLAIDALAGLMASCAGRLEDPEATLRDALAQLQLAFVQFSALESTL